MEGGSVVVFTKSWGSTIAAGVVAMTGTVVVPWAPAHAADSTTVPPPAPTETEGDPVGSAEWGDVTPREENRATGADGTWAPERDLASMFSLAATHRVHEAWVEGATGKGVTVAVIDTGIAPVPGLDIKKDKVMDGPDLSFDAQSPGTRYVDGFGHGTHLAGIIAGEDEKWDRKKPDPAIFAGVAPEAQLLNVKVGASDGGADVSQVIAALDWIVQHRKEGGMDVRVISLAYGTASPQSWQVDPLARAVENAWKAGIVVVAAAGNDGLEADSLLMPAVDPHVLSVGALDPRGTPAVEDDVVADFTNGGNPQRRPDLVAPGRSIVSLRVPGSYADTMSPEGRVEGDVTGRFFRGSGTSQATAFVAGLVALLLDERKKLTPDEVKQLLVSTAKPLPDGHPAMGAGVPDIVSALEAETPQVSSSLPLSRGTGSLEASRGGEHVVDPVTGAALTGEVDAMGQPWSSAAWVARSTSGETWNKGVWNGRVWAGDKFSSKQWRPAEWTGPSWSGRAWQSRGENGASWEGRSWRGGSWEGRSWRQKSWRGRSWRSLF